MEQIVLGSTSEHKLNAVRQACVKAGIVAEVSGVKAPSGQNEQPVGWEQTFQGALNRAKFSSQVSKVAIGMENGIFRFGKDVTIDLAVVVILFENQRIVTTSLGIQFPEECVRIAENRGFKTTTIGSVIAEKFGCDGADPHQFLTQGAVSRLDLLRDAVYAALIQMKK